ncbi:ABC transporter substrate-binding protein [Neorhizobium sp. NCHU2750]|uniref:ABC transporter substrate-binding protein n=1 Tax=Neorhizobium sp. NCHU2750 TaxID=1825976 RepID=UPI000E707C82|nr:amino acid ABC transporter substrate-binding protein [Neorhizobium sp. NCHU2750]
MTTFKTILAGITIAAGIAISGMAHAETLKVGSTPTGVPFTFLDTKTNKVTGVMVDIMAEIAKEAGFDVETEPLAWSALIPSLTSGKIDAISAAMFATPARAEVVDFTNTIYGYGEGLFVSKSDTTQYVSYDELKGQVIGAQIGTIYIKKLQDSGLFAEVKGYETIQDMMRDVNAGRIKAAFADYPIVAYQIAQNNFPNTRLVTSYKPTMTGDIGIAIAKGNPERLAKLNAAIAKVKADGRIDAIVKKWGL